ncbi:MAG TPA: DUF624 domain-containing protein [Candidatus Blautia merdavium]|uniref:DUF624 domain-containing protein n=1 Tax=Candidatus Blautia merdavium TaxID=2838494 RepID=A0A9D2PRG1_9FIRM|nr:DUF624 domain-containing protein [Candidatus Blautia merdavium]
MKLNINSPVFQFLNTFTEFVLLNAVFLITCIPLITIGASITALYTVTLREARGEEGYLVHSYWKAFLENFRKSTLLFLVYFASGCVLLFNLVFWLQMQTPAGNLLLTGICLLSLLWLVSLLYVFPLQARFENSLSQTLRNALLLALSNRLCTVVILLLFLAAAALFCLTSVFRLFLLVFGFAFLAYCNSFFFLKVFRKYEPEQQTPEF